MKMRISTFWWTGWNSESMSNSTLGRRVLASDVNATTAVIFHELDTQEHQGQIYLVLWIKIATGRIHGSTSVST